MIILFMKVERMKKKTKLKTGKYNKKKLKFRLLLLENYLQQWISVQE